MYSHSLDLRGGMKQSSVPLIFGPQNSTRSSFGYPEYLRLSAYLNDVLELNFFPVPSIPFVS